MESIAYHQIIKFSVYSSRCYPWELSALAVKARKMDLFELMPLLTDEYVSNIYNKYDIDRLNILYQYTLSVCLMKISSLTFPRLLSENFEY